MTDTSKPTVDVLEATQKFGEQLVSTVKQTQSLVLDAARAFAGALPSLPSGLSDNLCSLRCPTCRRSRPTASISPTNCLPRRRISL